MAGEPKEQRSKEKPQDFKERLAAQDRNVLYRFIRDRVRSDEDAEDILQDILTQTLSLSPLTSPIEDLSAWLFRSARNRIIDWWRRGKTKRDAGEVPLPEAADSEEGPVLAELLGDSSAGPDRLYRRERIREALVEALAKLPAAQREVFLLHELEGVSFKEMAEASGTPLGTLLARKKYAVDALKRALAELQAESEEDQA
jgi:RNA polymerase sigma factor (sigma-70 family)